MLAAQIEREQRGRRGEWNDARADGVGDEDEHSRDERQLRAGFYDERGEARDDEAEQEYYDAHADEEHEHWIGERRLDFAAQRNFVLDEFSGFLEDFAERRGFFAGLDHSDEAGAEYAEGGHRGGERASAFDGLAQLGVYRLEVFAARLFLEQFQHFRERQAAAHERRERRAEQVLFLERELFAAAFASEAPRARLFFFYRDDGAAFGGELAQQVVLARGLAAHGSARALRRVELGAEERHG